MGGGIQGKLSHNKGGKMERISTSRGDDSENSQQNVWEGAERSKQAVFLEVTLSSPIWNSGSNPKPSLEWCETPPDLVLNRTAAAFQKQLDTSFGGFGISNLQKLSWALPSHPDGLVLANKKFVVERKTAKFVTKTLKMEFK